MNNETCQEIEVILSKFFKKRINLIVPNISWGLNIHECDLLIISKSGYATEVEIKVSIADLKKDLIKRHHHIDYRNRIKNLYFAFPEKLEKHLEKYKDFIPPRAGILIIKPDNRVKVLKKPQSNPQSIKFSSTDMYKVARLGSLRIWGLKEKIIKLNNKIKLLEATIIQK